MVGCSGGFRWRLLGGAPQEEYLYPEWKKRYAVGYVTNAIESGHKQEKGRYVPALGKKLTADRVAGKGVYAGARQRAERIAYQAAERFVKKIQQKLKEG